jgi:hypothetical protein
MKDFRCSKNTTTSPRFSDFPTEALEFVDAELALLAAECRQATMGSPARVGANIIIGLRFYVQLALQGRKEPTEPPRHNAELNHLEHQYRTWSQRVDQARAQYEACPCPVCLASLQFCEHAAGSVWSEMKAGCE